MWYCATSIYRAGGNVTRHICTIPSPVKPKDTEIETSYYTIVNKYFHISEEAEKYLKEIQYHTI